ncbi:hypothetical protein ACJX0J_041639, partial [Zea mays]
LERFDDFTIASSWEKFISEIEAICRQWLQKGAEGVPPFENLYMIKRELKHGKRVYSMEYHFMKSAKGQNSYLDDDTHSMQLSFGVDEFLVLPPFFFILPVVRVILDDPESTKLLILNITDFLTSIITVILPNDFAFSNWPAFVPVHDPSRKAYIGIQNLGTVFTRRFEADRIGSQVPIRLMHLEGLHELFLSKFVSFELTAIWGERTFEETLEMAEVENASSFDADSWFLHPVVSQYMVDDSIGKFVGFASQLHLLVNSYESSAEAQFLEDFVAADTSGQDNAKSTATVPPPSVIDRVMKDLFSDVLLCEVHLQIHFFGQFCLHALWFGNCNICAIAALWIDFVREIRWCWEESERLPRMKSTSSIDLSCLIHQKLQMLDCLSNSYKDLGSFLIDRGRLNTYRERHNLARKNAPNLHKLWIITLNRSHTDLLKFMTNPEASPKILRISFTTNTSSWPRNRIKCLANIQLEQHFGDLLSMNIAGTKIYPWRQKAAPLRPPVLLPWGGCETARVSSHTFIAQQVVGNNVHELTKCGSSCEV